MTENAEARPVEAGDISPSLSRTGLEQHTIESATDAARVSKDVATRDVLHRTAYTNKDLRRIGPVDSLLVGRAHIVYELGEKGTHIIP